MGAPAGAPQPGPGAAPRGVPPLPTLALLGLAAVHGVSLAWVTEDAFIYFRYVDHWIVHGLGPVFNAGEWVLGCTSVPWLLALSATRLLAPAPEASLVLGLVLSLASVAALLGLFPSRGAPALPLAALLVASNYAVACFMTSGLETSLVLLALAGTVQAVRHDPSGWRLPAWAALLATTRLELALVATPCVLLGAASRVHAGRDRLPRALARAALPPAAAVAALVGTLAAVYGAPFPNGFYAKSGLAAWWDQGGRYLADFGSTYPVGPVAALAVLGLLVRAVRGPRGEIGPGAALGIALALYTAWVARVGGDFMHGRMLLPSWVLLAALADVCVGAGGLAARAATPGRQALAAASLVAAGVALIQVRSPGAEAGDPTLSVAGIVDERLAYAGPERVPTLHPWAEVGRTMARLAAALPGDRRLAVSASNIGIFGHAAGPGVVVVDDLGLTDPVVARGTLEARGRPGHEKGASPSYLAWRGVDVALAGAPMGRSDSALALAQALTVPGLGILPRPDPDLLDAASRVLDRPDLAAPLEAAVREVLALHPPPWADCEEAFAAARALDARPSLREVGAAFRAAGEAACRGGDWATAHRESLLRIREIARGPARPGWPASQLRDVAWYHRARF
ncbi:hypothetical protein L6R50_15835 [Myxococcota bacterium]|nr:hypothetical protein [Myxococcota bacterium]